MTQWVKRYQQCCGTCSRFHTAVHDGIRGMHSSVHSTFVSTVRTFRFRHGVCGVHPKPGGGATPLSLLGVALGLLLSSFIPSRSSFVISHVIHLHLHVWPRAGRRRALLGAGDARTLPGCKWRVQVVHQEQDDALLEPKGVAYPDGIRQDLC